MNNNAAASHQNVRNVAIRPLLRPFPTSGVPDCLFCHPSDFSQPEPAEIDMAAFHRTWPGNEAPPRYIRDQLRKLGEQMIQDIRASKMLRFFKQGESERCEVVLNKPIYGTSVVPSHVLSVRQGNENFRSFLVHEIVFAANCATLPLFPYSRSPMDNNNLSKRFTLPVVSLEVPSLESFYLLHEYLYTKDAEHLLMILTGTPDTSRADLYRHMEFIRGLWRNAHALSVVEAGLYDLLKIAFLKTKAILHSSI